MHNLDLIPPTQVSHPWQCYQVHLENALLSGRGDYSTRLAHPGQQLITSTLLFKFFSW